jgi:hypothetical protein
VSGHANTLFHDLPGYRPAIAEFPDTWRSGRYSEPFEGERVELAVMKPTIFKEYRHVSENGIQFLSRWGAFLHYFEFVQPFSENPLVRSAGSCMFLKYIDDFLDRTAGV